MFMVHMVQGKSLLLTLSVLAMMERRCLPEGQPLKQFVVGLVNVLNDPMCLELVLPGDVFSTLNHSVKGFPILRAALAVPDSDASREHRLYCGGVDGCLQCCGDLQFPQQPEVIQYYLAFFTRMMCHVRSSEK